MKFTTLAIIGAAAAQEHTFTISADDKHTVFVGGVEVGSGGGWSNVFTYHPESYSSNDAIAIHATETCGGCWPSYGSARGIIGVFDGVPSNSLDWKCKYYRPSDVPSDWADNNFDDTEWQTAVQVTHQWISDNTPDMQDAYWFYNGTTDITEAEWFWLDNNNSTNINQRDIYCRNGGTHGVDPITLDMINALNEELHRIVEEAHTVSVGNQNVQGQIDEYHEGVEQELQRLLEARDSLHEQNVRAGDIVEDAQHLLEQWHSDEAEIDRMSDFESAHEDWQVEMTAKLQAFTDAFEDEMERVADVLTNLDHEHEHIQYLCHEHNQDADAVICQHLDLPDYHHYEEDDQVEEGHNYHTD